MKMIFKASNLFKYTLFLYLVTILVGCANIVPPSGGPRDSTAPYLIVARPKDSSTSIRPKEILLGFNEYITTNDIVSNLIISPTLKNTPLIESRLNAIRIRIKDSLESNTTYSLQFGNAIKDVNEGNIAKDFTYTFSTGNSIDTGSIKGKVKLAETGLVDSSLIVVLHPTGNDTAIFKNGPNYYTKLNGKGQFAFHFLPQKSFQIFAIPNDYSKKYDDSTKLFAFNDALIEPGKISDSIQLYAFQAYKKIEKSKKPASPATKNLKAPIGLKYTIVSDAGEQDVLQAMQIHFENKIQLNDSFPLLLCDTFNKVLEDYKIILDSSQTTIQIQYPWEYQQKYHLILPSKSIQDDKKTFLTKTDTLSFKTKSNEAYGTVLIRLAGIQKFKNPVLLFVQDDKVKYSYPIKEPIIRIPQILPGDFMVKVLEDENGNGIWDTGNYTQRKQPEKVLLTGSNISIRANWENEYNIILNK